MKMNLQRIKLVFIRDNLLSRYVEDPLLKR